jgi:phosphocarrier protein HPr
MPIRQVVISSDNGMHARPVAELVRLALAHSEPVTLTTSAGVVVDLSSVLAVMELALGDGEEIMLATAPAHSSDAVLDAMAAVLDPQR